jgi:hypothetical protein
MGTLSKQKRHASKIAKQGGLACAARKRARRQAAGKDGPLVYHLEEVRSRTAPLKVSGEVEFKLVDGDVVLLHYQPPPNAVNITDKKLPQIHLDEQGRTGKCLT